jgi:hypothetical protein
VVPQTKGLPFVAHGGYKDFPQLPVVIHSTIMTYDSINVNLEDVNESLPATLCALGNPSPGRTVP